jgi:hypothetical protein
MGGQGGVRRAGDHFRLLGHSLLLGGRARVGGSLQVQKLACMFKANYAKFVGVGTSDYSCFGPQ